jgi:membrane-bound serine protease (ClpP class)
MMLGFYGLIFELQNPGSVLPGIVGGISLLLALFALSTLPVNATGVALLVLGLAFLLAEIKVQSHGLLAVGGSIALALGALMLFQDPAVRVALPVVALVTAITVAFFLVIVGAGMRARGRPVVTGAAGLVGVRGIVLERLAPAGRVRIGEEVWNATADEVLDPGTPVEVAELKGLVVRVRPARLEG